MSSTMELEVADLERICREAATYATQHNEARLLLEKQLGKTRSELTESERRRNLETQRLAAQIEKMRVELLEERERVGVLETEFASAFETELRNISSTYIKAAVEDTANLLEKLKKDLTVSEREKAVLMSKNAQLEKEMAKSSRRQAVASVWTGTKRGKVGSDEHTIEWPVVLWDVVAVVLLALMFGYCLWHATAGAGAGGYGFSAIVERHSWASPLSRGVDAGLSPSGPSYDYEGAVGAGKTWSEIRKKAKLNTGGGASSSSNYYARADTELR